MTPYVSKAISATRFPIILGPVMIHCQTDFQDTPYRLFWGEMVGRITVPLFFVISGYLFFQNFDGSIQNYFDKFKKRVTSLIVPYILWNFLAFLYYCIQGETTINKILDSFWVVDYHSGHSPADGPLWFLRTLILIFPLVPLMYYVNKNRIFAWLSVVAYFMLFSDFALFNKGIVIGYVCFNLGAYFALAGDKRFPPPQNMRISVFLLYGVSFVLLCLGDYYFREIDTKIYKIVHWTLLTIGSIIIMWIPYYLSEKVNSVLCRLGHVSFFIFCLHEPLIPIIQTLPLAVTGNGDLGYTLTIALTITICLISYFVMQKVCPNVLKVLNGGR